METKGYLKKILLSVTILALVMTMDAGMAFAATEVDVSDFVTKAYEQTEVEGTRLIGKNVPVSKKYQALIDHCMLRDGRKYKGSGECYGYAEMMRKRFGTGYRKVTVNKKYSGKNIYKYLKDVKPGTHVRIKYGSNQGHSIVIFKVTKTKMYYADANVGYTNEISYYEQNYDRTSTDSGATLQYYLEPTGSYKVSSTTPKALVYDTVNKIELVWQPIKGASSYTVYRSYSKNGKYTKLGTVTNPRYTDKTAKYRTVYYKVKTGSYTTKPVKVYHRLKSVDVTIRYNNAGYPVLSWKKVPNAYKYYIYQMVYPSTGGLKYKSRGYTSKLSYTFKKDLPRTTYYTVRAKHKSNSNLDSYGTMVCGLVRKGPKPLIKSAYWDPETKRMIVKYRTPSVNKTGTYLKSYLVRSTKKNSGYVVVNWDYMYLTDEAKDKYTSSKVYEIIDSETSLPSTEAGKTYYYRLVTENDNGKGSYSDPVKVTITEPETDSEE